MKTKSIESRWHRYPRFAPFFVGVDSFAGMGDAYAAARALHETSGGADVTVHDAQGAPVFSITTTYGEGGAS